MSVVSDLLFGVKLALGAICFCAMTMLQLLIYKDARKDKSMVGYGMLVGSILLEAFLILSALESYGY